MQAAIEQIIKDIKQDLSFDSHFVIDRLLKKYPDQFLVFASGIDATTNKTLAVVGQIGLEISRQKGIERLGDAWSIDMLGNPAKCACWRKL